MKTIEILRKVKFLCEYDIHLHPLYGNLFLQTTTVHPQHDGYRYLVFQDEMGKEHSWSLHEEDLIAIKPIEEWK